MKKLFLLLLSLMLLFGVSARADPPPTVVAQASIAERLLIGLPSVQTYVMSIGKPVKIIRVACPVEVLSGQHLAGPDMLRSLANSAFGFLSEKDILPFEVQVVCSAI